MPNWVKNIVHAIEPDVDFEKFTDENGNFTFEKIIPMPENIYRGNLGEEERRKYGENNWYDWSHKNWGTKWDARETRTYRNTVEFNTAWSCPLPVLRELGKKVGGILVFYADEDIGSNLGGFIVRANGSIRELDNDQILGMVIHYGMDVYENDAVDEFRYEIEEGNDD